MTKRLLAVIGIAFVLVAVYLLKEDVYPTSGLMFLSVGAIILLVATVLKFRSRKD